ncbi:MAG: hypothetical protein COT11_06250 [Candidatus Infernicultor aquiphilus]|nr:MAG: hypothetical protein COT11_06250 [Candidatus Atribacteria bacterium CG08_land_8_20_14_0_20_33_29]
MEDIDRTKEQLINELIKLRKKIAKLESVKISHKLAEKQLVKSEADKRMYQDKLFRAKSREKYLLDSF